MVQTQGKIVFDGWAKIRVSKGPRGSLLICAEVGGPDTEVVSKAMQLLVNNLEIADSDMLAKMASDMRRG